MSDKTKPKAINYSLIQREENAKGELPEVYRLLDELVAAHHPHLASATIAIAWQFGINEDADGHYVLGRARKASDIDYQLHGYDFLITLNSEAWNRADFTGEMRRALLDHELCHCAVTQDASGEDKVDEHGRTVWRIRKHDIEEFHEVVTRHGVWKKDLQAFVERAMADERIKRDEPLLSLTDDEGEAA